jgi:hypothetical protein
VIPNDGEWHNAFFSFAAEELIMVPLGGHGKSNASFSAQETLGNVNTVRFSRLILTQKFPLKSMVFF